MHRRPDLFPSPDSFLPQRFLNESAIPKDAFRPFEKGPRNCIGQELAMIELKIILLLTVREFDFEVCYGDGPKMEEEFGGRAYQMLKFSPKPNEGLPVRVTVRGEKE
jgi:cytochrome P450